jgi:hypothetical protein
MLMLLMHVDRASTLLRVGKEKLVRDMTQALYVIAHIL